MNKVYLLDKRTGFVITLYVELNFPSSALSALTERLGSDVTHYAYTWYKEYLPSQAVFSVFIPDELCI